MSGPELGDWQGYDRVFGLGDNLDLMGAICTVMARAMGGSKTASPPDFVPFFAAMKATQDQTPEEQEAMFGRFEAAHNGGL